MKSLGEIVRSGKVKGVRSVRLGGCEAMMGSMQLRDSGKASVIWSQDEHGLEHVSVSPYREEKTPTWDDMCQVKDLFFYPEEEAVQLHPKHSEYVNVVENVLHIYRPKGCDRILEEALAFREILEARRRKDEPKA